MPRTKGTPKTRGATSRGENTELLEEKGGNGSIKFFNKDSAYYGIEDEQNESSREYAELKGENAEDSENPKACKPIGRYHPHKTITNLMRWNGTVLPGIITRPTFIASLTLYVLGNCCHRGVFGDDCKDNMPEITVAELSLSGSLLTFFLAFYATNCYGRFQTQYTNLKQIEGVMRTIAIMMRHYFQMRNIDKAPMLLCPCHNLPCRC